jgi:hypothetical protein
MHAQNPILQLARCKRTRLVFLGRLQITDVKVGADCWLLAIIGSVDSDPPRTRTGSGLFVLVPAWDRSRAGLPR